jgi:hypothetical protein
VAARLGVAAGLTVLTVLAAGLLAVALVVWRDRPDLDADRAAQVAASSAAEAEDRPVGVPNGSAGSPGVPPGPVAGRGAELHAAACRGTLELHSVSPPVADPGLVEVSGVAVDADGVAWVVNDSGDSARVFGLRPGDDGTLAVQTVTVTGAVHVDWEDVALGPGPDGPVLWLADTGDNAGLRPNVVLYRIPVPGPAARSVAAEAVTVVYPDGPHDVEAVVAEPGGSVVLLTKEPGRSRAYRVEPPDPSPDPLPGGSPGGSPGGDAPGGADGAGGADAAPEPVVAEELGAFPVGDGATSVLTSAALSADGTTMVLRTYGSVFVVAVPGDRSLLEALADPAQRCRALPPMELQGEAVGLRADAGGYVTMGEGTDPYLTTVVAPEP